MAQGLQIFDESGNVIVDMQTRTSKVLGEVTINDASHASGSLTDKRLLDGTMWYAITRIMEVGGMTALEVKANGSTLSWTQKYSTVGGYIVSEWHSLVFIYGIY